MGRLIDADDIKIDVTNRLSDCISIGKNTFDVVEVQEFIFNIIRNIPTAYDVAEQMKAGGMNES